jgi:tryptophan synthase alpha chain
VAEVADRVSLIRNMTALPIAVGFGIKDADSARAVAGVADAVVVGSALIDQMVRAGSSDSSLDEIQIHQAAVKLLQSIREGVDSSRS